MAPNQPAQPEQNSDPIATLMALLRDSSRDPLGPYVSGRGEFAPRWQALGGLVKLGAAAVEPLCHALQDQNANTRRFAATALSRIGDRRAVAPLLVALQTSELYAQRYIAAALAVLGDAQAVEPLYQALQNPELTREALAALQAVLARVASNVPNDLLRRVASLADNGHYVAEVPNTDDGYLTWERVEQWLDCRPVKALAQKELDRRGG